MLFAERHRKLGRDGSLAHDRAEDLLTSTAFQLLSYLSPERGLLAILRRVRAVRADGRVTDAPPTWFASHGITQVDLAFWPHWGREYGQPDVVMTLWAGERAVGRVVVEVKLDAGKSGEAGDEPAGDSPDPDQLRRYWQGLKSVSTPPALGVVYLTAHALPPTDEVRASLAREPGGWLGWLSWRDVWRVAWEARRTCPPAADLAEILALKGLHGFEGFGGCVLPVLPASPRFWAGPPAVRWFDHDPFVWPANSTFWHGA